MSQIRLHIVSADRSLVDELVQRDDIGLAAVGELPLALFCLWIALNAERALRTLTSDG